jgi:hypothetical protein
MHEYEDLATIRFDFELVEVSWPDRWWTATRTQLTQLVDPDEEDGQQRYDDRDDVRWDVVGELLEQVSTRLDAGECRASDVLTDTVEVDLVSPQGGVTLQELRILESWFTFGEYPRADGWDEVPGTGRRRIFNVWKHRPGTRLPLRSLLLDYVDDVDTERLADAIRRQATEGLPAIPAAVRSRSPRYVDAVTRALDVVRDPRRDRS